MASKNKDTRTGQVNHVKKLIELRSAELKKNKSTADEIKKDKILKHLKAELKRANNAVAAIEKRESILQGAKKIKAERANKDKADKKNKKESSKKQPDKKQQKAKNKKKSD